MKKYIIFLIPVVFLLVQCDQTPVPTPNIPDLPRATQEGKYTIGCYINGKPWVPKPYISIGGSRYLEVTYDTSRANFFALSSNNYIRDSVNDYLRFYVNNASIGNNNILFFPEGIFRGGASSKYKVFILDTTKLNFLKLNKINTNDRIISGQFQFTAITDDRHDTIIITDGRFDTKF